MGKKKEKTADEKVMDFLTKIKNVFNKDIYIKDNYYVFAGKSSNDSIYGDIICYLEPEYKLAIEEFLGIHDLIKISDIVLMKKLYTGSSDDDTEESTSEGIKDISWDSLIEYYEKDNVEYAELEKIQTRINDIVTGVAEWKSFTKYPMELLETVFSDNSYIEFRESSDMPYVVLGKKLFPLVTLKNMENLSFKTVELKDKGLNAFCVNFSFTHFRVQMIYYFLALNN